MIETIEFDTFLHGKKPFVLQQRLKNSWHRCKPRHIVLPQKFWETKRVKHPLNSHAPSCSERAKQSNRNASNVK